MSPWLTPRFWLRTVVLRSLDQRRVSLVDDFIRDLRHGARLLRRNPGFAAVVLATLAIALGPTVTVFSLVDAWLLRPLNFPEADRLVIAFGANPERPNAPAVWMPSGPELTSVDSGPVSAISSRLSGFCADS